MSAQPIAGDPPGVVLAAPDGSQGMGRARAALDPSRGRYLLVAERLTDAPYSFDFVLADVDGTPIAGSRRSVGFGDWGYNPWGQPSVAYNPTTDEFLVVWSHGTGGTFDPGSHTGVLSGVRVAAATGEIVAGPFVIIDPPGGHYCEVRGAEVVYNPADGGYLVAHNYAWFTTSAPGGEVCVGPTAIAAGDHHSLRITSLSGAGVAGPHVTLPGSIGPVPVSASIAGNPVTGEFMVVATVAGPNRSERIVAQLLSTTGALTGSPIDIASNTANSGRVAADPLTGNWLVLAFSWDEGAGTRAHVLAADGSIRSVVRLAGAQAPAHAVAVGDGTYVFKDVSPGGYVAHLGSAGARIGAALSSTGGDQLVGPGTEEVPLVLFGKFGETGTAIGSRVLTLGPGDPVLASGTVRPGERVCFTVAGLPGDVALVNLTPVAATAPGYGLLVSSDVADPPTASNVNYAPGSADPNVAVAPIGSDGAVCYLNGPRASVHLVADHLLTVKASAITLAAASGAPLRVADTRSGLGGGRLAPADRACVQVAGEPGDVALVNLTPVLAAGAGHGQLVSSDVTVAPRASNVNYAPGTVDPNVAAAPIGADGKVCFVNGPLAAVDLVADHLATIAAAAVTLATPGGAPLRVADTRSGQAGSTLAPNGRVCVTVTGAPRGAALVNLTPVLAAGAGYGQLVSSDVANPPVASNVNYAPGTVDPNVAAAPIGRDGQVCFVNGPRAAVDVVADHLATLAPDAVTLATPGGAPARRVDTRPST